MRKQLVVALLVVVALLAALRVWRHFRPGVTRLNFDRIQLGMTAKEVEALMGEKSFPPDVEELDQRHDTLPPRQTWWSTEGMVTVDFDREGTVIGKDFDEDAHLMQNFRTWLLDLLGIPHPLLDEQPVSPPGH
jgi:hypothetical protein